MSFTDPSRPCRHCGSTLKYNTKTCQKCLPCHQAAQNRYRQSEKGRSTRRNWDGIIRGLRNGSDFEYEFAMAQINKGLNPKIRTVFFMADDRHACMSGILSLTFPV